MRPAPRPSGPRFAWIPPGRTIDIVGFRLSGGMLYLGERLQTQSGITEPALIDPTLAVDRRRPDWDGEDLFYWPSYESITPASRAAYLTWLADGRRHPGVPLGYVFLFFYGLERRVLVDAMGGDAPAREELPAIDAEVRRLAALYGNENAFGRYCERFLDVLVLLQNGPTARPPEYGVGDQWEVPLALRLGLARFAAGGRPVPPDWAMSWSWFHPSIYARTPQTRCPAEFTQLFRIRYQERHGEGLIATSEQPSLRLQYSPASAGLLGADVDLHGVPDLLEEPGATRALKSLVDDVTQELEAYSRFIGRNPDQAGSLAAAALLPVELATSGPAETFLAWARASLGDDASVVVDGDELIGFWPTAQDTKMSKKEVVACAQLLERHGIGIEPDVRLGGAAISAGPVVLFDASYDPPRSAGTEYVAATTLLQLAVAVSAADGDVDSSEQQVLLDHLGSALALTPGEVERLIAHLHWLTATGSKLTGLTKRLREMPEERRRSMADVLVAVAAADGVISGDEVKTLGKIYKLLGLDPDDVYSRLHSQTTVAAPVERTGRRHSRAGVTVKETVEPAPPGTVDLDPALLAASAAGTAAVSSLLAEVFADTDAPAPPTEVLPPPQEETGQVPGLDAAHGRLYLAVLERSTWGRAEFAQLAESHGLLPDGALDVLNDHAVDTCGEPLLEDEGDLVLNDYAVQEIPR
nr:TerB N-terminal domain-containing protein [Pseudonocardia oroxyli]